MTIPYPNQEGWEREFEVRFGSENYPYIDGSAAFGELDGLWDDVRAFIRQTLSQARASTLKEVGELAQRTQDEYGGEGTIPNEALDDLITALQEKGDSKGSV